MNHTLRYTTIIFDIFGVLLDEQTMKPIEPGVQLLQWFKDHHFDLYALSNIEESTLTRLKKTYPLIFASFKEIITPKEAGHSKPDKRIFEYTLNHYALTASTVLFIDDMEQNIASAQRVGMQTLWCPTPAALSSFLEKIVAS